jgi:hypothetical protein
MSNPRHYYTINVDYIISHLLFRSYYFEVINLNSSSRVVSYIFFINWGYVNG